jgi:fructokinase
VLVPDGLVPDGLVPDGLVPDGLVPDGLVPEGTPPGQSGLVTVAGEALIDLVDEGGGRYRAYPGGSPANVAVGLARLGVPSSLLARISGDPLGRQIEAWLAGNGVSPRDVTRAAEPTTLALATLDGDGRAAYSFYLNGTADWQWHPGDLPAELPPDVAALHTGSMVLALPPGAAVLEDLVAAEHARDRVTISIDPNIRPTIAAGHTEEVARVERQLGLAHIVKASQEDTGWLYPGAGYQDVARSWQRLGPRAVVITLGERGAFALAPDGTAIHRPARDITIVDTVGAGDAFSAGLLDALRQRGRLGTGRAGVAALTAAEVADVVDRAILIAALTCARAGADPPTRAEALQAGLEGL